MKRLLVAAGLGTAILVVVSLVFQSPEGDSTASLPAPTELAPGSEESSEFKRRRREWMDNMHRSAPDLDWRAVNAATRQAKLQGKLRARKTRLAQRDAIQQSTLVEEIAGGTLRGVWREVGSNNQAGRIVTCDVNLESNTLYAASAGGNIWVGTLDGAEWRSINDYLRFNSIRLVKNMEHGSGSRLAVVQGSNPATAYYTDDEGETWHPSEGLDNIERWGSFRRAIVTSDNKKTIYAVGNEWDFDAGRSVTTMYTSVDHGATYTRIDDAVARARLIDIWTPADGSSDVYALLDTVMYAVRGDNSLMPLGTFHADFDFRLARALYLSGGMRDGVPFFYVVINVNGNLRLYYVTQRGQTWQLRGGMPTGLFSTYSFSCSLSDPALLYAGGVNAFYSHDGGRNWTMVNAWGQYYGDPENRLHADIPEIKSFADERGREFVMISTDGGIYISRDSLQTVKNLSLSGLRVSQYYTTYTHRTNPNVTYAGSQDQGLQRSASDTGTVLSFEQVISGDYGHMVSGDNGNSLWSVYPTFAIYYFNAAEENTSVSWRFATQGQLWLPPLLDHPLDANRVFYGGGGASGGAHLWLLTANGAGVGGKELPFDFSGGRANVNISAMEYAPLEPEYLYVMTNTGQFFHSSDFGESWSQNETFAAPAGHYFYGASIVASNTHLGRVYVAGSGYSNPPVYVSEDHGETFREMWEGLPNTLVYKVAATPDDRYVFAATPVGPYVYVREHDRWYDLAGVSGPDQNYWSVEYIPALRSARFGTYGRGIWDFQVLGETAEADALLTDVLEPAGGCDLGDSEQVRIRIANNGDAPVARFTVGVNVTNGQTTRSYLEEGCVVTIIPGNTIEYVLNTGIDLSSPGKHSVQVYIVAEGERNPANDSATVVIENIARPNAVEALSPVDKAADVKLPVVFTWQHVPAADEYALSVWPAEDAEPERPDITGISDTTYLYRGTLSFGGEYRWRVTATNSCHKVPGAVQSFKTQDSLGVTSVDERRGAALANLRVTAMPNPAPDAVRISYFARTAQTVSFDLYDGSGRLVRHLQRTRIFGKGALVWDGRDASARRPVPGVYYLRLESERGATSVQPILLLR